MKVLFISSSNTFNGISPIIKNQGESLIKAGLDIRWVLGETERFYITSFDPEDVVEKVKTAHTFGK